MQRPLKRGADGILRDSFGRPYTFDADAMHKARRISEANRQATPAARRSVPPAPYVKPLDPANP